MKPIAVIAIGGNSLTRPGERGTFAEQQRNAELTCQSIAEVLDLGYRVVLTHGNGPQVGQALLRAELAQPQLPGLGLDECDAETEGEMGYLLQQTLCNVLAARGRHTGVVSLVTQVVVSSGDPAFRNPTKPIGPFYRMEEALERQAKLHWTVIEDSGRGWRRLVPSPRPLEIVEMPAVRACVHAGLVVIAAGGGGIPVVREGGQLRGVDAVIDKDRASALLARSLHADLLLFSTGVDRVALRFNLPDTKWLDRLSIEDARAHLANGEFAAGSMGPKIEAALDYLRAGGRRVVITSPDRLAAAVRGEAGTEIVQPVTARQPHPAVA